MSYYVLALNIRPDRLIMGGPEFSELTTFCVESPGQASVFAAFTSRLRARTTDTRTDVEGEQLVASGVWYGVTDGVHPTCIYRNRFGERIRTSNLLVPNRWTVIRLETPLNILDSLARSITAPNAVQNHCTRVDAWLFA